MNTQRPKILIGIPTCLRPLMLSECLCALARLHLPEEAEVSLVVVDNDSEQSARGVVEEFIARAPFAVAYTVEVRRGLVHVRNAILEYAIAAEVDYLATMDDDDLADKEWLRSLYEDIRTSGGDVLSGARAGFEDFVGDNVGDDVVRGPLADDARSNKTRSPIASTPYRVKKNRIGTGNVIMTKRVYKELGLRFDPLLNTVGREDVDFFKRAARAGADIYASPRPKVYIREARDKRTLSEEVVFLFQSHAALQYFLRKYRGKSSFHIIGGALMYLIKGVVLLIPALFSKRQRMRCINAFVRFASYLCSLFGVAGEPYKHIAGH